MRCVSLPYESSFQWTQAQTGQIGTTLTHCYPFLGVLGLVWPPLRAKRQVGQQGVVQLAGWYLE